MHSENTKILTLLVSASVNGYLWYWLVSRSSHKGFCASVYLFRDFSSGTEARIGLLILIFPCAFSFLNSNFYSRVKKPCEDYINTDCLISYQIWDKKIHDTSKQAEIFRCVWFRVSVIAVQWLFLLSLISSCFILYNLFSHSLARVPVAVQWAKRRNMRVPWLVIQSNRLTLSIPHALSPSLASEKAWDIRRASSHRSIMFSLSRISARVAQYPDSLQFACSLGLSDWSEIME